MINKPIFRLFLLTLLLFQIVSSKAQILEPVKWTFTIENETATDATLVFTAKVDKGWHVYSQYVPEGGPVPTSFSIKPSNDFKVVGKVTEQKPIEEYDKNFEMKVPYFNTKAVFKQKIKKNTDKKFVIKGLLEFMCCDDEKCLPPAEVDFQFTLNSNATAASKTEEVTSTTQAPTTTSSPVVAADSNKDTTEIAKPAIADSTTTNIPIEDGSESNESMWWFFWLAFGAGLIAILTPCIFPMIPMTISFFMGDNKSKAQARLQAIVYGLSIIVIYTVIGTFVAIVFGANFANWLSTHWIPNVLFFVIFLVFAASFFGAFEITLPSWIVNKSDAQADKGGITGAFFMALTLVVVSFSCTGPLVGSILVASAGGAILKPIIGMFGFALAFALPFTFFALFPAWLNSLPKSGGWLNAVKVVLGFIELALGLKFLSVADQTYHWGILDREIYLAFWIVIFALMGFYLLGKLKFPHDSDVKHIGIVRLFLSIITFTFVIYLIPGMFGAPLKALSGYLPPQATHDFDINTIVRENISAASFQGGKSDATQCEAPKYGDKLHLPHGLKGYFDYEQGMKCAKQLNKPVFIDFTGHGCVNCREMEANVWSDPAVLKKLREEFVVIALYVDDKTELPESEWITSTYDGKVKSTIGKKYADFQISKFKVNAQPYYVILGQNGELMTTPSAYDLDVNKFVKFLDSGIKTYNEKYKK